MPIVREESAVYALELRLNLFPISTYAYRIHNSPERLSAIKTHIPINFPKTLRIVLFSSISPVLEKNPVN
jgi:hypothetical protein